MTTNNVTKLLLAGAILSLPLALTGCNKKEASATKTTTTTTETPDAKTKTTETTEKKTEVTPK
jgi:hypothetical protein